MAFRIVSIGDSIIWGQGLLQNEKFDWLVQQALLPKHAHVWRHGGISGSSVVASRWKSRDVMALFADVILWGGRA